VAGPRKAPTEEAVPERSEREEEELSAAEADADSRAGGEPDAGGTPGTPGAAEASAADGGDAAGPSTDGNAAPEVEPAPELEAAAEDRPAAEDPLEVEDPPEAEDPLAVAQRERDEYLALAQRTQADFENWRKRAAKEAALASRRAKSGLAGELLGVVDNLERALESATDGEGDLAVGVRLVHSELISVLGRHGIEPFDPSGERFDPALHEALATRAEEGSDPGLVLDVVEKGYRLADSVLRPARVVVSA